MGEQLPPNTEQLFRITSITSATASQQRKLREGRRFSNARFMFPQPVETVYRLNESDDGWLGVEHKVRAHIRKSHPSPEIPQSVWSLRLVETLSRTDTSYVEGVATTYAFEWTSRSVLKALKKVVHRPTLNVPDLLHVNTALQDDAVDMLTTEIEMQQMTYGDCQLLERSLRRYCQESNRLAQVS